jgi:hypothetical protein
MCKELCVGMLTAAQETEDKPETSLGQGRGCQTRQVLQALYVAQCPLKGGFNLRWPRKARFIFLYWALEGGSEAHGGRDSMESPLALHLGSRN